MSERLLFMKAKGILPFARQLIDTYINEDSLVIDATCGNGNDTLYLAQKLNGNGHIYAFDIQESAIHNTKHKTSEFSNITYIQAGHETVLEHVEQADLAIFNLGYLPKGDKTIVTVPDTTIKAIDDIFSILTVGGIIILVIYPGHPEGAVEKEAVMQHLQSISQDDAHIFMYQFINQKNNPPFVVGIEKR